MTVLAFLNLRFIMVLNLMPKYTKRNWFYYKLAQKSNHLHNYIMQVVTGTTLKTKSTTNIYRMAENVKCF